MNDEEIKACHRSGRDNGPINERKTSIEKSTF